MKPGSILFINRVYPPVAGATGQLLADLASGLAKEGWGVTVVTSRPTADLAPSEILGGVRVERVGAFGWKRQGYGWRALGLLALYPALLARALRMPRHETVVTMTDPPLQHVLGPVLKAFTKCRLVHWAQDLYPEVAEELGVIRRGGRLARGTRAAANRALRSSDLIIAVGRCMKIRFIQRGLPPDNIVVLPNWDPIPPDTSCPEKKMSFKKQHGLEGHRVVMYSGNLGLAHPFGAILEAAERLKSSLPDTRFVFVGNGPRLPQVQKQVQERRLDNVRLLPPQSREDLRSCLSAADLHLACMQENLSGLVVPSKVYGVLAVGRPCIFLGPPDSEAAQIIEQHQCGSVLRPNDGKGLADCLSQWLTNPNRLTQAGQNASRAAPSFTFSRAFERFQEILRFEGA